MSIVLPVDHDGGLIFPTSASSGWRTVLAEGVIDGADNSGNPIILPASIASVSDRYFIREKNRGTILRARLRYLSGDTITTDPVLVLFGRYLNNFGAVADEDFWSPVRNKAGDFDVTFPDAADDPGDGTYDYTIPGLTQHAWDCDGYNQFFFGVKTAAAATSAANILVQARWL